MREVKFIMPSGPVPKRNRSGRGRQPLVLGERRQGSGANEGEAAVTWYPFPVVQKEGAVSPSKPTMRSRSHPLSQAVASPSGRWSWRRFLRTLLVWPSGCAHPASRDGVHAVPQGFERTSRRLHWRGPCGRRPVVSSRLAARLHRHSAERGPVMDCQATEGVKPEQGRATFWEACPEHQVGGVPSMADCGGQGVRPARPWPAVSIG